MSPRLRAACLVTIAAVAAAAACEKRRSVKVVLGVSAQKLSLGYTCPTSSAGPPLWQRAVIDGGARFQANLVVDFVDLGDGIPGCRGEELLAWCEGPGDCSLAPQPGGRRYCAPVEFLLDRGGTDLDAYVADVYRALGEHADAIVTDAPDGPVIVRAVMTTEPCDTVAPMTGGAYPAFDAAQVAGCAYSCPVVIDDISTEIHLSIDAVNRTACEPVVLACARGIATP